MIHPVTNLGILHKGKPKDGRSVIIHEQVVFVPTPSIRTEMTTRQAKRYFDEFECLVPNIVGIFNK